MGNYCSSSDAVKVKSGSLAVGNDSHGKQVDCDHKTYLKSNYNLGFYHKPYKSYRGSVVKEPGSKTLVNDSMKPSPK